MYSSSTQMAKLHTSEVLVNTINNILDEKLQSPLDLQKAINMLRRSFRLGANVSTFLNYDELGVPFLYKYFLANYTKAKFLLSTMPSFPPGTERSVIDLGSGSGAASAAALCHLNESYNYKQRVKVILVDRCKNQLSIACRILEELEATLQNLSIEPQFVQSDILEFLHHYTDMSDNSFFLLAHVLCELPEKNRASVLNEVLSKKHPVGREFPFALCVEEDLRVVLPVSTNSGHLPKHWSMRGGTSK